MALTKEAIVEFRDLYKAHYGIELSEEEASKAAHSLLRLYKAVYFPRKVLDKNGE